MTHLNPENLALAQRHLVAKAIAEFSHELLVLPEQRPDGGYRLRPPERRSEYRFAARIHPLEHWCVDPESITRTVDGRSRPLDVQELVTEFAPVLGIPDDLLPTYLEELASTLAAACWKLEHHARTAAELVHADLQTVEAAMTEGHPGFLANSGRIGFGARDHAAYAPETGSGVRLVWVAVRRELSHLALGDGLTEETLYGGELDPATREAFTDRLRALGLDPADYHYLPLHPWQWDRRVQITFAPDVARRDLVPLGEAPDTYQAQQSIRTFFNRSRPERHYVKTALAVQNMGFLRGLSPAYLSATPAINDWLARLVAGDPELVGRGFTVLRERASIGYTGDAFHRLPFPSAQRKMLAALWRESPMPRLGTGERAATMASLLHRDAKGVALVSELIADSPVGAETWVRAYLDAYLRPLVHCLLRHDLAFMPHGENVLLVLAEQVPVRVLYKDVGEEIAVLADPATGSGQQPLPEGVERIRAEVPRDEQSLAIHTDVFDGFLRFLGAILDEDGTLPENRFWTAVRECIQGHLADHPELADAAREHDLLRPRFRRSCLNRLQLRNTLEMVDLASQSSSLQFAGELVNPAAPPG